MKNIVGHERPRGGVAGLLIFVISFAGLNEARAQAVERTESASPFEESVSVEPRRIEWSDIVELINRHPRLVASQQQAAAAQAGIDAAGAFANPSADISTAYGQAADSSASKVEWGLALSLPLDWIAKRPARMDVARAETRVAEAETQALRREVLHQLRVLFWRLVYEQDREQALRELKDQADALTRTVQRRVEQGEVRPVEALRVEVESEKIASELDSVRLARRARQKQLAAWLGVQTKQELVASAQLDAFPSLVSAAEARARVRKSHPEVAAATARVAALAAELAVAKWARLPATEISGFADQELDRSAYGLGLSVELPVLNLNGGNIERSGRRLEAQKNQLEATRIEIENAAVDAQASCQAGVSIAARYRGRILPRASQAAQTIERTYELGEASLLEVIDARRTLLETRTQYLSALMQAHSDCSRLAALVGEDTP